MATKSTADLQAQSGWVSINEVAAHWSISRDTARRLISEQGIERRKLGRSVRVPRRAMLELGQPIDPSDVELDWDL